MPVGKNIYIVTIVTKHQSFSSVLPYHNIQNSTSYKRKRRSQSFYEVSSLTVSPGLNGGIPK